MTTDNGLTDLRARFWRAASEGDAQAGRHLVQEHLDAGVPGAAVLTDVLVPTQHAVGLRWQRAEISVGDEHAASAVVDAALAVVEGQRDSVDGPLVVVVCAETEWHTLPARIAAELIRGAGVHVRFLGPSLPADHLREYLARLQPDAVVISATMPTSLPGAARSIAAARDVRVPVIVGGAAFGDDDWRARVLLADAWFPDAAGCTLPRIAAVDGDWADWPARWEEYSSLCAQSPIAVELACSRLVEDVPALAAMSPVQVQRTREDLAHILDFLAVSILVSDLRVLQSFTTWLAAVLAARGVPGEALPASYRALADVLVGRPRAVLWSALQPLAHA